MDTFTKIERAETYAGSLFESNEVRQQKEIVNKKPSCSKRDGFLFS
jgi:hypothetical protein